MTNGIRFAGAPSDLDERSIRRMTSVVVARRPIMAGAAVGWYETISSVECAFMPWVAQFVLRCPRCRSASWVTGRGRTRWRAVNAVLSNVTAHMIVCEGGSAG